jgi:metal-responsive CopG/Arc/MetJ family transcriptional regulator
MAGEAVKLTVSLPQRLIAVTDEVAHEKKISRSRVISLCLQELAERMEEGYKSMARENLQFAEQTIDLAREAL